MQRGHAPIWSPIATTEELQTLQAARRDVYVDPALVQYAVKLVAATRNPAKIDSPISANTSPTAPVRVAALRSPRVLVRWRRDARQTLCADRRHDRPIWCMTLRHRISLSYEALSDGVTTDAIPGASSARWRPR